MKYKSNHSINSPQRIYMPSPRPRLGPQWRLFFLSFIQIVDTVSALRALEPLYIDNMLHSYVWRLSSQKLNTFLRVLIGYKDIEIITFPITCLEHFSFLSDLFWDCKILCSLECTLSIDVSGIACDVIFWKIKYFESNSVEVTVNSSEKKWRRQDDFWS